MIYKPSGMEIKELIIIPNAHLLFIRKKKHLFDKVPHWNHMLCLYVALHITTIPWQAADYLLKLTCLDVSFLFA